MCKWMCAAWCSGSDESLDSVKKDSPNELPQLKPVSWKRQVEGRWWIDFFTVWAPGLECHSSVLGADAPLGALTAENHMRVLVPSRPWTRLDYSQPHIHGPLGTTLNTRDCLIIYLVWHKMAAIPQEIRVTSQGLSAALCPDVSRPTAPGQKASPRSTPILTPLQFLFGDL